MGSVNRKPKLWVYQLNQVFLHFHQFLNILMIFKMEHMAEGHYGTQRARKFKKVQAKKLVKSNKSKKNYVKVHFWQF